MIGMPLQAKRARKINKKKKILLSSPHQSLFLPRPTFSALARTLRLEDEHNPHRDSIEHSRHVPREVRSSTSASQEQNLSELAAPDLEPEEDALGRWRIYTSLEQVPSSRSRTNEPQKAPRSRSHAALTQSYTISYLVTFRSSVFWLV